MTIQATRDHSWNMLSVRSLAEIIVGSGLIALAAQVAIPFPLSPVPVTLQTLAVSILALRLGPQKAFACVCAYLMEASLGLPVLAGGISNPAWFVGFKAGYLASFPLAAWVVGTLVHRLQSPNLWKVMSCVGAGQLLILGGGTAWLALFLGIEAAFYAGFLPFLLSEGAKCFAAATCAKFIIPENRS